MGDFSQVRNDNYKGHKFKIRGQRFSGDVCGEFFTQRVVGAWNALLSG